MASNITQAERLMRLETNLTNLDKKVDGGFLRLDKSISDLSAQIQMALPTLVTHDLMTQKVTELEEKIVVLETRLENEKKSNNLQTWVTGTLSAVLGSILTFLTVYFFTNVGGN